MILGRPLGRFPVGVASNTCLDNLSWGILVTWIYKFLVFLNLINFFLYF